MTKHLRQYIRREILVAIRSPPAEKEEYPLRFYHQIWVNANFAHEAVDLACSHPPDVLAQKTAKNQCCPLSGRSSVEIDTFRSMG